MRTIAYGERQISWVTKNNFWAIRKSYPADFLYERKGGDLSDQTVHGVFVRSRISTHDLLPQSNGDPVMRNVLTSQFSRSSH